MSQYIEHKGVVKRVKGDWVEVLIEQHSACSGCHAKSACTASDTAEKIVEVPLGENKLSVGDVVTIQGALSLGRDAVILAFVLPLLLLFATLFIANTICHNELLASALAVGVLIPYYLALYLNKAKMRKRFLFTLK